MKILLFNPPTPDGKRFIREGRCTQEEGAWGTLWPPLSLATAAAVLERAGHIVRLRDFPAEGKNLQEFENGVRAFQPDAAIWSSATPSLPSDLAFASTIKAINPRITTCTFGTHVGTLSRESFEMAPQLDYIIRGEPELTVHELIEALEGSKPAGAVPGLAFLRDGKELVVTEPRSLPKNLDDLPDPAWHLLDLNSYRLPLKGRKFLMVVPTRGCPFACSFCTTHSYYGSNLRRRSPARVVQEIRRNIDSFGVYDFLFWSDTFTLDRQYVKDLCQAFLDAKLNISWACNSRVDTADLETFKVMKKAGCWMVSYGIESANQDALNLSKKGAEVLDVGQAIRWTKEAGLMATGHFVLGLPGDTVAAIEETVTFSMNLGLDFAQYYCAVPFPGSSLFTEARAKGWLPDNVPWEQFRQENALLQLPDLPPLTVQRLRAEAYRRFYSNPRTWLSKIQMIRPAFFPKLLSTIKAVIGWRHTHSESAV
jgi:anaerobic magnesium-protoporphyrin IX monomethyl ester cyclase